MSLAALRYGDRSDAIDLEDARHLPIGRWSEPRVLKTRGKCIECCREVRAIRKLGPECVGELSVAFGAGAVIRSDDQEHQLRQLGALSAVFKNLGVFWSRFPKLGVWGVFANT